ncbi:MAG: SGNH/GDSL hydrolase family protein [Clostridia bacterium]|nr:SGNH/GDSL hydrolase family protein [Clostridia bacterium]
MIWKNAELYNVSELKYSEEKGGWSMLRVPESVADNMSERGRVLNLAGCGCEIRFRLNSGSAKIKLSAGDGDGPTAIRPVVYYGSIGSGWEHCFKNVFSEPTEIEIPAHDNMDALRKIHSEHKLPFAPELVRVILQNRPLFIYDISGDIEPPKSEDAPKRRYLAYGSSITHGSLALLQVNTWTNRIAENTGSDLINLGFAGAAHLEPCIADYIASRNDFDFATLEMGINILDIDPEDFRGRVRRFVSTIAKAHPDKMFFCIDVFYCSSDLFGDGKAALFRKIVRDELADMAFANTVHIDGLKMLTSSKGLSGDLVHPNVRGVEEIAANLTAEIKKVLYNNPTE